MKALRSLIAAVLLGATALTGQASAQLEQPDIVEILEWRGEVTPSWAAQLAKEQESWNDRVKALVIVLDSPGGGVIATKEVYDQLGKVKIPVVVWCNQICASGGLYIAMAPSVRHFAVRDVTITGSMGVLVMGMDVHRLLEWAKLDPWVFKSGDLKDSGSGMRPLNDADKAYYQGIVDYLAGQFYAVVRKARPKITTGAMEELKTAKIVFGEQAVSLGLADAVSDKDAAIAKAKALSGSTRAFTREELQKMAKAAEKPRTSPWGYQNSSPKDTTDSLSYLVNLLEEIRTGRTQRVMYLMPIQF